MTKDTLPLPVPDLSAFARSLRKELTAAPEVPSHLALMNMLARSAGFRNFQHLRNYLLRRKVENFPWEELVAAYKAASKASN